MDNNGTILLIDNDIYLNNIIQMEFYWRNYMVLTAMSYDEARYILKTAEPDIILMEANLPDGDGFGFLAEVYSKTDAGIIIITNLTDNSHMLQGMKMGCDDYIKKPFHREVMIARVEVVMRRKKSASL